MPSLCFRHAALVATFCSPLSAVATAGVDLDVSLRAAASRLSALSVPFVENAGQHDRQVRFTAPALDGVVFVDAAGSLVYALPAAGAGGTRQVAPFAERFVGGHARPRAGGVPHATNVAVFTGADEAVHRPALRSYEHVSLGEVFAGIDVRLRATGRTVEKIFTLAPGADPRRIAVRLDGVRDIERAADGSLRVETGGGDVRFSAPIAFQTIDGRDVPVPVSYYVDARSHRYGFDVGPYDRSLPLVIDPLLQNTYLGGSGEDVARAIAIHPATGEVYVTGHTWSTDFPKVGGSEQILPVPGGTFNKDVFVTRLNAALTKREQSTYIGGNGDDTAYAIAISPLTGDVYVAGETMSTNFPKVTGGYQAMFAMGGTGQDGFVVHLNAALTSRLLSTYYGNHGYETISAIAVHPVTGDVYVAGYAVPWESFNSYPIPGTAGGAQQYGTGLLNYEGFVAKFNAALTSVQATYLSNQGNTFGSALAISPWNGWIYVAGSTNSTAHPGTGYGSAQRLNAGGYDAYVSAFAPTLQTLYFSTYAGGTLDDGVSSMAVDPATGDIVIGGNTYSDTLTSLSFGCAAGSSNQVDGFVIRVSASLRGFASGLCIGTNELLVGGVAVHPALNGEVLVTGHTNSTSLPQSSGGVQTTRGTGGVLNYDAYVARVYLGSSAGSLSQTTYLGGNGDDYGNGIAIHPVTGDVYIAGATASTDLGSIMTGAEQTTYGGGPQDAYVARYSVDLRAGDTVPNAVTFTPVFGVARNALVTAGPVQVTGLGAPAVLTVQGTSHDQACISSTADCSCNVLGWRAHPWPLFTVGSNQYLCVRHVSAPVSNALRETSVAIGGLVTKFRSYTGTDLSSCKLDVDGNGTIDALTDGLMMLRAMLGMTGTAVTTGALGANPTRNAWASIRLYLNGNCGTSFAQ